MNFNLDKYTVQARLLPPLLSALPLALVVVACQPEGSAWWAAVWGAVTSCGGTVLIAQISRDLGQRKETDLFKSWGGPPTTVRLRHRCAANPEQVIRWHRCLARICPDLKLPSRDEEANEPVAADNVYAVAVNHLVESTRDRRRFQMVYEENCNYGFRRNLLGMKPVGVAASVIGVTTMGALFTGCFDIAIDFPIALTSLVINLFLLLTWVFWITPNWVRKAAETYAKQLLVAIPNL